ncbi:MAG TPA: hypothetical protein PKA63_06685 [Oligoflexia bacterium]|nr:hypothetical protein [Oligoflexia bacterium]HMP48336.1 hypothetical protein [Oligoflexia bacterium]
MNYALATFAERSLETIINEYPLKFSDSVIHKGSGELNQSTSAAYLLVDGARKMRELMRLFTGALGQIKGINFPEQEGICAGAFYTLLPEHQRPQGYKSKDLWLVGTVMLRGQNSGILDDPAFQISSEYIASQKLTEWEERFRSLPDCCITTFIVTNEESETSSGEDPGYINPAFLIHGMEKLSGLNKIAQALSGKMGELNMIYMCRQDSMPPHMQIKISGHYGLVIQKMEIVF